MRFSAVLCKQHIGFMFKKKWEIMSKRKIIDLGIPESLKAMNVKIYDARELVNPKIEKETVELPDPYCDSPFDIKGEGHPHWNEKAVYLFNRRSRFLEGHKQAMALTKAVGYEGFPPNLIPFVATAKELDIEELVQHCLLEALVWDGAQRKLPKKVDITRPGWRFPREYGITQKRKVNGLLLRLNSLCERITGKNEKSHSRVKLLDAQTKVFVEQGDNTLLFDTSSEILIADSRPLPLCFNEQQVQDTVNADVSDIFPLKPTINLKKENLYTEKEFFSLSCGGKHLHTIHITHDTVGFWFPTQKIGRAIGCCFAFAASEAHHLYGNDIKELPSPLTVQCICLDQKALGFVTYQLNTLDIGRKDGVKNQVWIDGPHDLYEELSEEEGITGYNHETFLKMLAMHLNGTQ